MYNSSIRVALWARKDPGNLWLHEGRGIGVAALTPKPRSVATMGISRSWICGWVSSMINLVGEPLSAMSTVPAFNRNLGTIIEFHLKQEF